MLSTDGFMVVPEVVDTRALEQLILEVDRVFEEAGSVNVRNVLKRSSILREFAHGLIESEWLPSGMTPVRGILFNKTQEHNWPVAWHQDLTIALKERVGVEGYDPWSVKEGVVHVQPPVEVLANMLTLRLHLDDADGSNGALRVLPGSHREGVISTEDLKSRSFDDAVDVDCNAGDALLMSPLLLHSSRRSRKEGNRRVLHIEYADPELLDRRLQWYVA